MDVLQWQKHISKLFWMISHGSRKWGKQENSCFFLRVEIRTAITERERDELCESTIECSVLVSVTKKWGYVGEERENGEAGELSLLTVSVQKRKRYANSCWTIRNGLLSSRRALLESEWRVAQLVSSIPKNSNQSPWDDHMWRWNDFTDSPNHARQIQLADDAKTHQHHRRNADRIN